MIITTVHHIFYNVIHFASAPTTTTTTTTTSTTSTLHVVIYNNKKPTLTHHLSLKSWLSLLCIMMMSASSLHYLMNPLHHHAHTWSDTLCDRTHATWWPFSCNVKRTQNTFPLLSLTIALVLTLFLMFHLLFLTLSLRALTVLTLTLVLGVSVNDSWLFGRCGSVLVELMCMDSDLGECFKWFCY